MSARPSLPARASAGDPPVGMPNSCARLSASFSSRSAHQAMSIPPSLAQAGDVALEDVPAADDADGECLCGSCLP